MFFYLGPSFIVRETAAEVCAFPVKLLTFAENVGSRAVYKCNVNKQFPQSSIENDKAFMPLQAENNDIRKFF